MKLEMKLETLLKTTARTLGVPYETGFGVTILLLILTVWT